MLRKMILSNLLALGFTSLAFANPTYTVPTDSPFATSEVQSFEVITDENGNKNLQFLLNEDLIGPSKKPSLFMLGSTTVISPDNILFKLKDPAGGPAWALCESRVTEMSCTVDYEELEYDQSVRNNFLKNKFKDQPEVLLEKLNVANTFGVDPGGFLKVSCETDHCGLLD